MTDEQAALDGMDIIPEMTVRPEDVFSEMTARKAYLEDQIKSEQAKAKLSYEIIAAYRDELRTVNRLLSASKPRNRAATPSKRTRKRATTD